MCVCVCVCVLGQQTEMKEPQKESEWETIWKEMVKWNREKKKP
jgi:hypothetical protein